MSFLPIFTLEAQEGRLFGPLAFTKTFAMAAAALLSVTLVPALMVLFVRGRIIPEHRNPINRFLIWIYRPVIRGVLQGQDADHPARARRAWRPRSGRRGSSAPSSCRTSTRARCCTCRRRCPGLSVTKAAELLQTQDRIIKSFPEVASVYGKAGRAATATDPAPTEMFETDHQPQAEGGMAAGRDASTSLIAEMDQALQFPGVSNAWTMPIKARIDMLSTGIRTPVGVKVFGTDLAEMETARAADRGGAQDGARHVERLRRAGDRRLLPRHRADRDGARRATG